MTYVINDETSNGKIKKNQLMQKKKKKREKTEGIIYTTGDQLNISVE